MIVRVSERRRKLIETYYTILYLCEARTKLWQAE